MPRKKKVLTRNRMNEADLETSDDQAEVTNQASKSRVRTKLKSPCTASQKKQTKDRVEVMSKEENQLSENGYEADSELEQKQNSCTDSDHADRSYIMAISTDSENETEERQKKVTKKRRGKLGTRSRDEKFFAKSTEKTDKENFTPPDSHSTPSLGQKVVRSLDDSLFGFNRLDSPLPFSPVSSISSRGKPSPSRLMKPRFVSNHKGKRKSEQLFDFPLENEKRVKKKKSKREQNANDNCLEELREQFKEVEMHELIVEYY